MAIPNEHLYDDKSHLVEYEYVRVQKEMTGHVEPLLLRDGQVGEARVLHLAEAQVLDERVDASLGVATAGERTRFPEEGVEE